MITLSRIYKHLKKIYSCYGLQCGVNANTVSNSESFKFNETYGILLLSQ